MGQDCDVWKKKKETSLMKAIALAAAEFDVKVRSVHKMDVYQR